MQDTMQKCLMQYRDFDREEAFEVYEKMLCREEYIKKGCDRLNAVGIFTLCHVAISIHSHEEHMYSLYPTRCEPIDIGYVYTLFAQFMDEKIWKTHEDNIRHGLNRTIQLAKEMLEGAEGQQSTTVTPCFSECPTDFKLVSWEAEHIMRIIAMMALDEVTDDVTLPDTQQQRIAYATTFVVLLIHRDRECREFLKLCSILIKARNMKVIRRKPHSVEHNVLVDYMRHQNDPLPPSDKTASRQKGNTTTARRSTKAGKKSRRVADASDTGLEGMLRAEGRGVAACLDIMSKS